MYSKPALFGTPNYREQVSGTLLYPDGNHLGCSAYPSFQNEGWSSTPLIVLIDRGNCSFSAKVANAQAAGAVGVIVLNNDAQYPGPLPYMSAGAEGASINIPAMIISGHDGSILLTHMNTTAEYYQLVTVAMNFFVPNVRHNPPQRSGNDTDTLGRARE